jgi:hypothetical protein
VLRAPDRANGQALWNPSCFTRRESARYSNRKLIPQFAFNGRSHELAARRVKSSNTGAWASRRPSLERKRGSPLDSGFQRVLLQLILALLEQANYID